ncbi:Glutathione S-transferase [Collimonas arenae]|uniref:Glutathione S-transferase n=1 Tax=Collimonas arenae TaxID=279058 RepID=A0A0A1FA43_9BURK|nr:Glutathione S-transferase [Collimonas arenae]
MLIALYENNIAFEKRFIDLGNEADRSELRAIWPFTKFPVLHDHVRHRDVPESTIIIEYLDHFFAGEMPLIPADWDAALDVRLWDRFFDIYVHIPMQQIVANRHTGAQGAMGKEHATLDLAYGMLEERMASRTWVAGSHFTMADCAAVPALFYASTLQRFPSEYAHLHAYFERLMERPSVKRVIQEAQPYFHLYPFADAIPARFRTGEQ